MMVVVMAIIWLCSGILWMWSVSSWVTSRMFFTAMILGVSAFVTIGILSMATKKQGNAK
jgi:hypothetical protein